MSGGTRWPIRSLKRSGKWSATTLSFVWTDNEVEPLLAVAGEDKVNKVQENAIWRISSLVQWRRRFNIYVRTRKCRIQTMSSNNRKKPKRNSNSKGVWLKSLVKFWGSTITKILAGNQLRISAFLTSLFCFGGFFYNQHCDQDPRYTL